MSRIKRCVRKAGECLECQIKMIKKKKRPGKKKKEEMKEQRGERRKRQSEFLGGRGLILDKLKHTATGTGGAGAQIE